MILLSLKLGSYQCINVFFSLHDNCVSPWVSIKGFELRVAGSIPETALSIYDSLGEGILRDTPTSPKSPFERTKLLSDVAVVPVFRVGSSGKDIQ